MCWFCDTHSDQEQEEVYILVEGAATVEVDGESVNLRAGDALRIDPDAKRQIRNGNEESRLVLVGAS